MERWLSWSKAHDWKSCIGLNPIGGSNPPLSAKRKSVHEVGGFSFLFPFFNIHHSLFIKRERIFEWIMNIEAAHFVRWWIMNNYCGFATFMLCLRYNRNKNYYQVFLIRDGKNKTNAGWCFYRPAFTIFFLTHMVNYAIIKSNKERMCFLWKSFWQINEFLCENRRFI